MYCFKGIDFSQFLSEHDEWHTLVLGFCETAWPVPPLHKTIDEDLMKILRRERWYYMFGRVLGGVCFVLFAVGVYHML